MKTKLRFLFVLLTMLWWGANFAWGDTEMCSAYLSGTSTPTATNCTLKFYGSEGSIGSIPTGTQLGSYYYAKMNDNANYYEITLDTENSGYTSFQKDDKITVYLFANESSVGFKIGSSTISNSVTQGSIASIEHTLIADEIQENGTLRLYRNSSKTYFAGIKVTTTRTANLSGPDYTVKTYPYTWDFSTIRDCQSEFERYSDWTTSDQKVYVRQTPSDYADSNYPMGYDITAFKGLRFSKQGYLAPDCYYNYLFFYGQPTITIPNVPVGSFVSVVGNARNGDGVTSGTVTGSNTTPNSQTNTGGPFVFKVNSTADVGLSFGDTWYDLHAIEVVEDDLPRYSTLPYEWRFSDASWWVTKENFFNADEDLWGNSSGVFENKEAKSNTTAFHIISGVELPETNNLTFTNASNNKRLGVKVGEYLWINTSTINLPSLSAGTKVTIRAKKHEGGDGTLTPSNAVDENGTDITEGHAFGSTTGNYTFYVKSNGPVSIDASGGSLEIYNIKVEKTPTTFTKKAILNDKTSFVYSSTANIINVTGEFNPAIIGSGVSASDFEAISSDEDVITFSTVSDGTAYYVKTKDNNQVNFIRLKTGTKVGTAVVTFRFKGNDVYEASSFNVTFNVIKADPTFKYTNNDKNQDFRTYDTSNSANNTITKGMDLSTGITLATSGESENEQKAHGITFSSSNTSVATVDKYTGAITFVKPGISIITAKFAGNDCYTPAETYFKLIVKGTGDYTINETLSWKTTSNDPATPPSSGKIVRTLGDDPSITTYPALSTGSTPKYMSSDETVATVGDNGAVTLKHPGDARIYAYIDGKVEDGIAYSGVSIEYELQVNGGDISNNFGFEHSTGTLTTGCSAIPRLIFPSGIAVSDIETLSLSVAVGGEDYVSVPATLLTSEYLVTKTEDNGLTVIENVYPMIRGLKATPTGSPVRVTATFVSPYYNGGNALTTYIDITVTDSRDLYSWKESKTEYTLVEGEYMMMPQITGNANGNIDGLSKGTVNQARGGYLYDIKGASRTIKYNSNDYYWGQGVPDYSLTPTAVGGGVAYIFNVNGGDSNHPALVIYGESAGDVLLRATDSQTGWSCGDITIHVVSKTNRVTTEENNFWANKKFPFTWDFTNIARTSITDDVVHWKSQQFDSGSDPVGGATTIGRHFLGMATSFDYNYADEQDPSVLRSEAGSSGKAETIAKSICNGEGDNCKVMPAFHGLRLALGNNSDGKYTHKRDKVSIYDTGVSDPRLYLDGGPHYLFLPELPSSRTPGTYKLFMKVKGHTVTYKNNDSSQGIDNGNTSHVSIDVLSAASGSSYSTTNIATESTLMASIGSGVPEIKSFDISSANAGKTIRIKFDKNVDVYWIALSTEEKPISKPSSTTYPAATYSYSKALDLSKSSEANTGLSAYYASAFESSSVTMTSLTGNVEKNTGLMLKLDGEAKSCYMIVDAENVDSYQEPNVFGSTSTNLLKSTGSGMTIQRFEGSESSTNFVLTNAYYDVDDELDKEVGGEKESDWSFVRVRQSIVAPANMAYLHVSGKEGDIETSFGGSSSRAILSITFDDEPETLGVRSVQSTSSLHNDAWYTLEGIRVKKPQQGCVYIHKGKKVIAK